MIGYLSGKVKFLYEDSCILDVNGVGYKVFVDAQTRYNLAEEAAAEFFIHTAVREDAITLFGIANRAAFDLFELLLNVSGIGAKSALAIVSKISATEFARAVTLQDVKTLTRLPGIGKKSAERILLELKDKIKPLAENLPEENFQPAQIPTNAIDEAEDALSALGYTTAEISTVLQNAPKNSSTEQLIKFALKELNRFA
ncbi:MAG: Holliday junction branch migration protein RuvA [Selenomonadaceae bacterium]|nr:Holliday junction branch migration protein RuvA [Selenomonadaceae bacterium]